MCGIAGVVGVEVTERVLHAMGDAMVRRGPDDAGFFQDADVGLAFRRLAIVDLAGGRQPMANEDGCIQLVFNGEIYDHQPVRRQLEARGHRFATDHSDTEVLVHGWEEWGYDLFARLNGMFAVAIWDRAERTLVLARDRYGIKPLYYALAPAGACVFGSEIKAVLASGLIAPQPCPEGVMEYFSFQNLTRKQTMFAGIHQLEPATVLTWKAGHVSERRFWDLSFPRSRRQALPALAEEHRAILQRAIKRQLAADVPVKSYLSGGIDSTAITVIAHQLDPDMTAYSCIFQLDDVGADAGCDERAFSRLVAARTGLCRVELELAADSLRYCLGDYVAVMEDLRMGMGYVNYLIAQRVARDAKVVLSGTGGDEFHAGYVGRFQALGLGSAAALPWWRRWLRRGKQRIRSWHRPTPPLPTPAGPEQAYRNMLNCFCKRGQWIDIFTPDFLRAASGFDADALMDDFLTRCPSSDWRDRVLYVDAKTYLAGLLAFEDKVSMAHSLEARVPLLDNELVDFLLDIPFEALWPGGATGKVLFRESVRPWVPEEIYQKPKMGFGPPDASWYRGQLRPWIEKLLAPQVRGERGVFQPGYVRTILEDHFHSRANHYHLVWSLLNFEAWCQAFGFFGATADSSGSWLAA
jgi:asparagine synthase (glutamine-hydrolysing)